MTHEELEKLLIKTGCYDYISSHHVEKLIAEVKRLTRERDALLKDIKSAIAHSVGRCSLCKFKETKEYHDPCDACLANGYWQWRGVQEADNEDA